MNAQHDAAPRAPKRAGTPGHGRGAVARLVTQLLTGEKTARLSYSDIAERVKRRIPEAHTSARSVACVASALRSAGHPVPDRRAKQH